ncbi:MAG: type II secretion system protein [Pseudomonadota bacterium]|nr:type II secretion system protein [Pseudomonadota bacterium]
MQLYTPTQLSADQRTCLRNKDGSSRASNTSGFSLLEVIIVVALLAGVYSYALPQFRIFTGLEESSTLSRLAVDIRSAYDIAVLTGKVHRLVFKLDTGEYWLEMSDAEQVYLGVEGKDHDTTEYEEQEAQQNFEDDFQIYEDMMPSPVYDPEDEVEIKLITPLIVAKEQLQPPHWKMVKNIEWQKRDLGDQLTIVSIQAEHHARKQSYNGEGDPDRAFLYFFPNGYVQQASIEIAPRDADLEKQPPYVIITNPFEGTATVEVAANV